LFRTTRRAALPAVLVAAGALLIAGCSSSSTGTSGNAQPSGAANSQQTDAYRQCLSEHGVTLPSGRPSGGGGGGGGGFGGGGGGGFGGGGGTPGAGAGAAAGGQSADPAMQQAMQACASLRPQGSGPGASASATGQPSASASPSSS